MAKYGDKDIAAWAAGQFDWNQTPELVALDVASLEIAHIEAQRNCDDERADQMAVCFISAVAAGVIVAESADGSIRVVDGQHRIRAARTAGQPTIHALLFRGMSEDQVAIFVRLKNGPAVRLPNHIDGWISAWLAGFAPNVAQERILAEYECILGKAERNRKDGLICCSKLIETIYANDGTGDLLKGTLDLVTNVWGHTSKAMGADVLEAAALFLLHHELNPAQLRDLTRALKARGLHDILARADESWEKVRGVKRANHIEAEMAITFNYRRSHGRLPERTPRQLMQLPGLLRKRVPMEAEQGA